MASMLCGICGGQLDGFNTMTWCPICDNKTVAEAKPEPEDDGREFWADHEPKEVGGTSHATQAGYLNPLYIVSQEKPISCANLQWIPVIPGKILYNKLVDAEAGARANSKHAPKSPWYVYEVQLLITLMNAPAFFSKFKVPGVEGSFRASGKVLLNELVLSY